MIEELTAIQERQLLEEWGARMASNLITHAKSRNIDLRPLLDQGYKWFDWLADAFHDEGMTRDLVFWGVSGMYALHFAEVDTEEYHARCWQAAQHAIHLIGRELYPPTNIRWHDQGQIFSAGGVSHWERSWPSVQEYNGELITVYYVTRMQRYSNGWEGHLFALSIEHLTEFDWLEFADTHVPRDQGYDLSNLIFDFVREGQGAHLWTSRTFLDVDPLITILHERAEYMATHFDTTMQSIQANGVKRITDLRAIGGEYSWQELREYREVFGGDGKGMACQRHSVRVYQYGPQRYTLDRCLDMSPPVYSLYYQDKRMLLITPIVKVDDLELWGDGISWAKAEAKAKEAVKKRTWNNI